MDKAERMKWFDTCCDNAVAIRMGRVPDYSGMEDTDIMIILLLKDILDAITEAKGKNVSSSGH